MYGRMRDELAETLQEIRDAGLYKSERELTTPQAAHVGHDRRQGAQLLRQQLPRPRRPPGRHRRRQSRAGRVGLRHGVGPLHLRHPDPAHPPRAGPVGLLRHRRHDPLLLVLRRQRGRLRGALRRARRDHLRRAQPRLAHRRHPAGQGGPLPLPQRRPDRPRPAARGGLACPAQGDRHRRGVLHGRLVRAARGDLRPGRAARRPGAGRRLARGRVRRRWRPGHAGAVRACRTGSTSSPARWARRWAAPRAGTSAATRRSSTCCASAPGPTCSPTRSPRLSSPGRWPPWSSSRPRASSGPRCDATPCCSAGSWRRKASTCSPARHPITPVMFPGEDGARRAAQVADHMLHAGVYVIAFSYPVVPQGKARIRVQLSAAHSEQDVRTCVAAFVAARDAVALGAPF